MRTLLVIVAFVSVVGAMGGEVTAQEAPAFVWERSCDVLPGQAGAAAALVAEWRDAIQRKVPGGIASVLSRHLLPSSTVHVMVAFPDLTAYQDFHESLTTDADYLAVFARAAESYDLSTCADELYDVLP